MHRYTDEKLLERLDDAEKKSASLQMQLEGWNLDIDNILKELQKRKENGPLAQC
jgi:hypothetical protein